MSTCELSKRTRREGGKAGWLAGRVIGIIMIEEALRVLCENCLRILTFTFLLLSSERVAKLNCNKFHLLQVKAQAGEILPSKDDDHPENANHHHSWSPLPPGPMIDRSIYRTNERTNGRSQRAEHWPGWKSLSTLQQLTFGQLMAKEQFKSALHWTT